MARRRKIIGIAVILLAAALIVSWERWGKDALMYEEAPVLKEDARAGTLVDESMITYERFERGGLDFLGRDDVKKLIGMETAQFVHGGTPLFREYFRDPVLSGNLEKGRFRMNIAAGWIESVPADLERGNRVCIYSQDALVTSVYAASGYEEGRGADVIAESRQIEAIGEAVKGGGKLILVKG